MLNTKLNLNEQLFLKDTQCESTRAGFGEGLVEIAKKDSSVVALTADLKDSTRLTKFAQKYPERFIEVGIAEQNMAGIAAGLAMAGKTSVMTSFATFNPGRNWEQIRVSIAYPNLNVKIVGSHSGFSNGKDGATAQALEDIALMRTLPNMTVINPIDYWEAYKAIIKAVRHDGPVYLRLFREDLPFITTKDTPFEIGRAYVLSEGKDVTILSTGPITYEVLEAKRELKTKHKIDVEIISCPTIKPLDEKTILASAKKTGKVVTVEEHQIAGGFGSAVCELLSEKHPMSVLRIGVNDCFGESGSYRDLLNKHGLNGHSITEKVLAFIK